ncbi:MAG: hypothetical protein AAFR46_09355 [Pseudomonadota bacterium]
MRAICVSLVALAVSFPALAHNEFEEDRLQLLVKLICENGGTMDSATAARVLPEHDFTRREVVEIEFELEDREMVEGPTGEGYLTLTKAACTK